MPNRLLRDWTDSENIDKLSVNAERFFTRLIMKVDDFGRLSANAKLLKSTLFPLKTDVRETDISRWLAECEQSALITLYNVASKDYLQIENFKQVLRQKKEKYPAPENVLSTCIADDKQMHSIRMPETKRNESEVETETEGAVFNEEKFLVPEMMKAWKIFFPKYPEEKKKDFSALREIAQFISSKEKIDCDIGIIPAFRNLSDFISKHDFYRNYSLLQVSRHIQNIFNNIHNGNVVTKNGSARDRQTSTNANLINKIRNTVTGTEKGFTG